MLLGHLGLMDELMQLYPKDAAITYPQIHIIQNWRKFFPGEKCCPPVLYLDIWPLQEPVAMVLDPTMCQDLVQERNQPRHHQGKHLVKAIAGTRNLVYFDGGVHRLWRSRLNPGFSLRNLQSHMPALVAELNVFVDNLKATAGKDGAWGAVFPLLPNAVDLTFDIIGRVVLSVAVPSLQCRSGVLTTSYRDLRLGEQSTGPSELQAAIRSLSSHIIFRNLATLHKRLRPSYHLKEWRCNRVMRRVLMPHIIRQIGAEQSTTQKTVVQLAMKEYSSETDSKRVKTDNSAFVEDVLGLTKQFLFAGHDTTAITISWAFHYLAKHPAILEKLRAEHDEVFGPDPSAVPEALRQSPHLLNSIPYTLAVVKEVLRVSPIAATLRQGSPGFELTGADGTRRPTDGFAVVTGTAAMHYHPDMWPRVNEFLPERWTVPEGHELHPVKYVWRPFEWGPMGCIGQELAMMELKMVLLFTVREMDVEPAWEEWDVMQ